MRAPLLIAASVVLLAANPGCGQHGFGSGRILPLVEGRGDQINADLEGNLLVWFDLEEDPNGACFVPPYCYDDECDQTCEGRIKAMNLRNGRIVTLSPVIGQETAPAISAGRAAWLCHGNGGRGLCITPADRSEVTFFPGVGWNYYHGATKRPALDGDAVVWAEYNYQSGEAVYRLAKADLGDGSSEDLLRFDRLLPTEVVLSGNRAAFVTNIWEGGAYHFTLETLEIDSGRRRGGAESEQAIFGLGARGDILAWKQGGTYTQPGEEVHVFYIEKDGQPVRADSDGAEVSAESPVAVGEGILAWLDFRDGNYRIAARDIDTGAEELITPAEAMLSAYQSPAASGEGLVFSDHRRGDWDLYLYRY